jgi:hypothetical protein
MDIATLLFTIILFTEFDYPKYTVKTQGGKHVIFDQA